MTANSNLAGGAGGCGGSGAGGAGNVAGFGGGSFGDSAAGANFANLNFGADLTATAPRPSAPVLALIVPCYNEAECIEESFARLSAALAALAAQGKISPKSYICFVDDGSKDATFAKLIALGGNGGGASENAGENGGAGGANSNLTASAEKNGAGKNANKNADENNADENTHKRGITTPPAAARNDSVSAHHKPPFEIVKLAKNAGHQNALLAGFERVVGRCDCCISIDADLQDDIGVLGEFVAHYAQGCEVVFGVRSSRTSDTFFKRTTAQGFYKFMAALGVNLVYNHADYRLMSAAALASFLRFGERNLFLRALVCELGYKTAQVRYERKERTAGQSKYPLKKMLNFALDGVTSFSVSPLRLVALLGVVFFFVSVGLGAWICWVKFFSASAIRGWATSAFLITFFGGIQLLSLGVIGEYVGKIYKEVKHRPRFFVERVVEL